MTPLMLYVLRRVGMEVKGDCSTMPRKGVVGASAVVVKLCTDAMATAVPRLWPTMMIRDGSIPNEPVKNLMMVVVSRMMPSSVGEQPLRPNPR